MKSSKKNKIYLDPSSSTRSVHHNQHSTFNSELVYISPFVFVRIIGEIKKVLFAEVVLHEILPQQSFSTQVMGNFRLFVKKKMTAFLPNIVFFITLPLFWLNEKAFPMVPSNI